MNSIAILSIAHSLQRGKIYKFLSRAFLFPDEPFYKAIREGTFLKGLKEAVKRYPHRSILEKQLTAFPLEEHSLLDFRVEHTRLFSTSTDFPPYGTDYLSAHIFMKTQNLADVAGFYRAFGLQIQGGTERVDHLSVELEFFSYLCLKEAYAAQREASEDVEITLSAQKKFLEEHLGRWAPLFLHKFHEATTFDFYKALARFTRQFLEAEATFLGVAPDVITRVTVDAYEPDSFICSVGQFGDSSEPIRMVQL